MTVHRPHVIAVRLKSHGCADQPQTMAKHPTKALPKTAVKLSASATTSPAAAIARVWNAYGLIQPEIEVLS